MKSVIISTSKTEKLKKFLIFIAFTSASYFSYKLVARNGNQSETFVTDHANLRKEKLNTEIAQVEKLLKSNAHYNSEIAFFLDMRIPSMKNRFFIYDLKAGKIVDQGLVAHGSGSETGVSGQLKFSNINNSLSTSLGKYAIGHSYTGKFGKAYKLYGLDQTNSNAFSRAIVLHKYEKVPYEEQETYICNSHGCPMVNVTFYSRIEKIIDASDKKIILNIYY